MGPLRWAHQEMVVAAETLAWNENSGDIFGCSQFPTNSGILHGEQVGMFYLPKQTYSDARLCTLAFVRSAEGRQKRRVTWFGTVHVQRRCGSPRNWSFRRV